MSNVFSKLACILTTVSNKTSYLKYLWLLESLFTHLAP